MLLLHVSVWLYVPQSVYTSIYPSIPKNINALTLLIFQIPALNFVRWCVTFESCLLDATFSVYNPKVVVQFYQK